MSNKKNNLKDMKNKIKRNSSPTAAVFNQIDNNIDNNNDIDIDDSNNNSIDNDIDNIINNNRNNDHVQIGIYFEPAVMEALKPLSKKKLQSKFVNAAVKKVLQEKGML